MQFLLAEVIFLMAVTMKGALTELNPKGKNVCVETVPYSEVIKVKMKVKDVEYEPCRFPFISNRKTSCRNPVVVMVEKEVPKLVFRTKIQPVCCSGYMLANSSDTECVPDCRFMNESGCENGKCVAPMVCECQTGYFGRFCEKSCPEGVWGKNCNNTCDCLNYGQCDKTYGCVCQPGWKGIRCESPCEEGYYGHECKKKCTCNADACSHITGECVISTMKATTISTTEDTATSTAEAIIVSTTDDTITSATETVLDTTILTRKDSTISLTEATTITTSEVFTTTTNEITSSFTAPVTFTGSTVPTKNQLGNGSSGQETIFKWLHFLPSLSVLSATSFLIIAIAGKWVITKHRRKTQMALSGKDRNVQTEDRFKLEAENVFMVNYCTVNPVYLTDVALGNETTTTLETFKPINNSSKQK